MGDQVKIRSYGVRLVMPPDSAPKDGTWFVGIPRFPNEPVRMVWDRQMLCFLTEGFAMVDNLSCWLKGRVEPPYQ